MGKHQVRMAKATKSDIENLYLLKNTLENVIKYDAINKEGFSHFEEDEKKKINQIFHDGEIEPWNLLHFLYGLTFGFHRVVMGFEVLVENACDQELDYLDYNSTIKEHFAVLELIGEDLRKKGTVVINSESSAGKKILELTKEDDKDEDSEVKREDTLPGEKEVKGE